MQEYFPRIADALLQHHLASKGAVLIEGANGAVKPLRPNILPKA